MLEIMLKQPLFPQIEGVMEAVVCYYYVFTQSHLDFTCFCPVVMSNREEYGKYDYML